MKWQITLVILATVSASFALAENFKTINGKEYKNVTVSRVEPDGVVVKSKSGISKIYFAELPKEIQQRFHYELQKLATSVPRHYPMLRFRPGPTASLSVRMKS